MGRPGYILVARQMGKTNLLLNAKRKLSNPDDKFLYIDVSNTFADIRHFFQNIIDTLLDSYLEIDAAVGEVVRGKRCGNQALPPHKEHENELRLIIQKISSKLVICLDEIDALTKTGYADQVFSFIRSTYFSGRVNFPEFGRLTYVLSGVAEPSELIKDKNVSPFNIGEKIYLDDFSRLELNTFFEKSALRFTDAITERIYYWTSGNPRMSWDICSALEDLMLAGDEIAVDTVDSIVDDMYLTNFDLPPIDHIRTLVEDDRSIRDAIMAIHYGKSESISDTLRSRLYLSGITKPDLSGSRKVAIRNRILIESLSEKWIHDIERRKLPIYDLASNRYDAGRFDEALALYEEYAASTNTPDEPQILYFKIGNCQYNLERYLEAIQSFEKYPVKKEKLPSLYYSIQHRIGIANLLLGEHEKSIEYFKTILEQDSNTSPLYFYFDSCINLSTALFNDFERNQGEIRKLNRLVIDSGELINVATEDVHHANKLLNLAYFNLANIAKMLNETDAARTAIDSARKIADERTQVFLALEASDVAISKEHNINILRESTNNIVDMRIPVGIRNREYPLDFNVDVCSRLVERLAEYRLDEDLDRLIGHLLDSEVKHDAAAGNILSQAAYSALAKGGSRTAVRLIRKSLILPFGNGPYSDRRHLITLAILLTPFAEAGPFINTYWTDYIETGDARLIDSDLRLLWRMMQGYLAQGYFKEPESLVAQIRELMEKTWQSELEDIGTDQLSAGRVLLDVMDIEIRFQRGDGESAKENIEELLQRLNAMEAMPLPYFAEDFLVQLRRRVATFSQGVKRVSTIRRAGRKYGRNDKVTVRFEDGRFVEGKYKGFEADLNSGACQIVA